MSSVRTAFSEPYGSDNIPQRFSDPTTKPLITSRRSASCQPFLEEGSATDRIQMYLTFMRCEKEASPSLRGLLLFWVTVLTRLRIVSRAKTPPPVCDLLQCSTCRFTVTKEVHLHLVHVVQHSLSLPGSSSCAVARASRRVVDATNLNAHCIHRRHSFPSDLKPKQGCFIHRLSISYRQRIAD